MKAAVIYYSLDGNTKFIAGKIAEKLKADVIELKPVKAYPTGKVSKFFWGGKSASFKEKPELESYSFRAEEYDTVIVGTPIWAGTITPPLRTFLAEYKLSGKRVAAFLCCSGGSPDRALKEIRTLAGKDRLLADMTLVNPLKNGGDVASKVEAFCNGVTSGVEGDLDVS